MYTVVFGVIAVAASIGFVAVLHNRLIADKRSADEAVASAVVTALENGEDSVDLSNLADAATTVLVYGPDGAVTAEGQSGEVINLTSTRPATTPTLPQGPMVGPETRLSRPTPNPDLPSNNGNFVVETPFQGPTGAGYVVATSSLAATEQAVAGVTTALRWAVPATTALVGLAAWLMIGKTLRPVRSITARVEQIESSDLSQRVPVPDGDDEIAQLADQMNNMLNRLEDAEQRQRQFIVEASHELRTPLAALLTRLELAATAKANSPEGNAKTLAQAHRLAELVDDLLILATLDDHIHPQMVSVDLEELVFAETQLMSIPVDVSGVNAVRINGDPKTLRRATSNLLANAARHTNGCIAATLITTNTAAVLTIDDDGPGVPIADRDRIFDRFTRVDPSHQRHNGGAGIGLALVSAVATEHGGSVDVSDSPLGGARFTLRLNTEQRPARTSKPANLEHRPCRIKEIARPLSPNDVDVTDQERQVPHGERRKAWEGTPPRGIDGPWGVGVLLARPTGSHQPPTVCDAPHLGPRS